MKRKGLIITLAIVGPVITFIGLFGLFFGLLFYTSEKDKADLLAYYKRDDCFVNVTATISFVEHNENNFYFVYLEYDEKVWDFRYAEYFYVVPSIAEELSKNGFDFSAFDKQYVFTIGRKSIVYDRHAFPIFAMREADDGGKVYLDYDTGKTVLLSHIA